MSISEILIGAGVSLLTLGLFALTMHEYFDKKKEKQRINRERKGSK